MNKTIISASFFGVALVAAGLYFTNSATAQETSSTQTFSSSRFAMIAGKLDVSTVYDNSPYTMNAMVLVDTQTGSVWMLQATVNNNNQPTLANALLVPIELSSTPVATTSNNNPNAIMNVNNMQVTKPPMTEDMQAQNP